MAEVMFYRTNKLYQEDLETIVNNFPWKELVDKSIAVTGSTGLLGSLIVDTLMFLNINYSANITIYALGRNLAKIENKFAEYSKNALFKISRFESLESYPDISSDFIIHCAGNSHPDLFAKDPVGTLLGNIKGAENVLRHATTDNSVLLMLSSGEIYGENKHQIDGMSEDYTGSLNLSSSRSCYTEGKRAVEALCQSFIAQYGTSVKIARPCRIFGPTMTSTDNKASAQFLKNAKAGTDIILKSSGEQLFSYIYSADAVSALLTILLKGENGLAYNISNRECDIRLHDFASLIADKAGIKLIMAPFGEAGGSKVMNALLNNNRLRTLGWTPVFNINEAIEHTLNIIELQ